MLKEYIEAKKELDTRIDRILEIIKPIYNPSNRKEAFPTSADLYAIDSTDMEFRYSEQPNCGCCEYETLYFTLPSSYLEMGDSQIKIAETQRLADMKAKAAKAKKKQEAEYKRQEQAAKRKTYEQLKKEFEGK